MNYKNLSINRDDIKAKLQEFADKPIKEGPPNMALQLKFEKDGRSGLLIVYAKKDGTTTIQVAGKDQKLGEEAAEYIIENINVVPEQNVSITLKDYSEDKFKHLVEYLTEECEAVVSEAFAKRGNAQVGKLAGKQGDTLTFSHYTNNTLLIQGRPIVLAMGLIEYLSEDENTSTDEMVSSLQQICTHAKSVEELDAELAETYPNAHAYAGDNLRKLLTAAVGLRNIQCVLPDYAFVCSSALRACEGFMKKIAFEATGERWQDFGNVFNKVGQAPAKYAVNEASKNVLGDEIACGILENCYGFYVAQRHGLFHADGVDAGIRIIDNLEHAKGINNTTLSIIEANCKILLENK